MDVSPGSCGLSLVYLGDGFGGARRPWIRLDTLGIVRVRFEYDRIRAGVPGDYAVVAAAAHGLPLVAPAPRRGCRRHLPRRNARYPVCALSDGDPVALYSPARRGRRERLRHRQHHGKAAFSAVVASARRLHPPGRNRALALWPLGGREQSFLYGSQDPFTMLSCR